MTLAEKVGQMQAIWENKGDIQNPDGSFAEAKAERAYPDSLGEITRPSDREAAVKKGQRLIDGAIRVILRHRVPQ